MNATIFLFLLSYSGSDQLRPTVTCPPHSVQEVGYNDHGERKSNDDSIDIDRGRILTVINAT